MKRSQIAGAVLCICLLLEGCGADSQNTDVFLQELQPENMPAAPASTETVPSETVPDNDTDAPSSAYRELDEVEFPGAPYAAAYRQFLETYVKENEYAYRAGFTLAFIDDNNVPELLLMEDNSHAAGVKVYTYYEDSVIELGEFGSTGTMQYVERGGIILSCFMGFGEFDSAFFRVEDGEAKPVSSLMTCEPSADRPEIYEIDGISVTEEAYRKKWEELDDIGEYIVIGYDDAYIFQESEPADLLAGAIDALLLHRESPQLAQMVAKQAEVLEGYGTFLTEYAAQKPENGGEEAPGYALAYLDDDDVPELIVIEEYAHAYDGTVYTFEKGEIVSVGEYGQYEAMGYREKESIVFHDCGQGSDIRKSLTEELENLILTQEEVLKRNILIAAGAEEDEIMLMDYDDYDGDGKYEVYMICGRSYDNYGDENYSGLLCYAGADCCMLLRKQYYRMIDGKMKLGPDRKYLFFYTDISLTANISELWTVEDGKPVESEFSQIGQVIYRGGNDFEIWTDGYDHFYGAEDDIWTGHTYKPYFYYYDGSSNRIEKYKGEVISGEEFAEYSGTSLIEEIEAEGYTVGTIIRWDNDVVTINYVIPADEKDSLGIVAYENVIWDNKVKDYWEKEAEGVTSWKNAGVGGSFCL